ncbi:amidohydrolase [uncultured Bifidobacterium sp.]|uniref:amidohydrolase n=1 Tax=uncultured Bifidobacterium sp. TaxID=165187 RepID=UPI0028DC4194|nr:amidohydrolase [uncultured Bifidobacterium sp.]
MSAGSGVEAGGMREASGEKPTDAVSSTGTEAGIPASEAPADFAGQPNLSDYLVGNYRWFHAHPELSYGEVRTTARIRALLEANGIETLDSGLRTGLVAIVRGEASESGDGRDGRRGRDRHPVIAIRGDIDALPLAEDTGLPYASRTAGVMHACGHDVNLSVALGAAILLQRRRTSLNGDVKVVFQPAEEVRADAQHPTGAVAVLRTGVLDDVEVFLGTHDTDALDVGTIGISPDGVSGSVDKFRIDVTGRGTHAAHPDKGVNPVVVLSSIVGALQSIPSQSVDPTHPRVLTVTHIEAGETWNVIPSDGFVEGTVRTADVEDRSLIEATLRRVSTCIAEAFGASADVAWTASSPSVVNDPQWVPVAREAASAEGLAVAPSPATLGGEDFSYYLQDGRPGLFAHVGVTSRDFPAHVVHSPRFAPDPAAILPGARFLARMAEEVLMRLR